MRSMPYSAAYPKARRHAETTSRVTRTVTDGRSYPSRPYLAVSAAIIRDGKVLIVRRARAPAHDVFTLPGGGVEAGGTLHEADHRRGAGGDRPRHRAARPRGPSGGHCTRPRRQGRAPFRDPAVRG